MISSYACAVNCFIRRRGSPAHLYSDNGTNFKGAESELSKALEELDQDKISTMLSP